jgi:hypothetical protein
MGRWFRGSRTRATIGADGVRSPADLLRLEDASVRPADPHAPQGDMLTGPVSISGARMVDGHLLKAPLRRELRKRL